MEFKSTPLFGGAIVADLPTGFQDVRFVSFYSLLHLLLVCLFVLLLYLPMPYKANRVVTRSEIREVPDTQEVYLSSAGYTSVLFDILERVTEPAGDLEALKFHLSDIVDDDAGDVTIVDEGKPISLARMP